MDHFSITQLTTYLNCPALYRYAYIQKLPWEFQPADLLFGSICHQVIADFHRKQKEEKIISKDELVADFDERWERVVSSTEKLRFRSLDEKQLKARGKLYQKQFSSIVPKDVELFFELPMLDLATGQYADNTIQGRIDLVSETTVYEIKTSTRSYTQEIADESLQLTFYSWAYCYLYGKPAKELKLITLVKTQAPKIQIFETKREMADFTRLYNLMTGVIDAIEKGIFYPNPMSLYGCQNCQFQNACKGLR